MFLMSDHTIDSGERSLSRRSFLGTGAKVGAGMALAGTALGAMPQRARAANVTLTYASNSDATFPHIETDLLKQFEALHPGVTCQWAGEPVGVEADIYHDKLVTVLSAHSSSIDVFSSDVIWQAQWAPAGWAATLDSVFPPSQQKNYAPAMIAADTVNGHIYGIPWLLDTGHLFYRKDILDANGLKPATTWQDLQSQCIMLAKKYPTMVPFVACYQKGQQLICNFMEYSWGAGGDFLDHKTGAITFNSPQNLQALETMIGLIKNKVTQPGVVSMGLDVGRAIFTQGNAIYHRNWNYAYGVSQTNAKLVGKIGVTAVPSYPGAAQVSCAGGWQYVVNNNSQNRDLAIELAVFLGSPKTQLYRTLNSDTSPAYLPANTNPQVLKKFPSYNVLAEQAKIARSRPKTPFWTGMSRVAEAELTNALIGSKSAQQALKDAQGKLEGFLAGVTS
jgi:multiple sugar transport system substrate-binding protein